MEPKAGRTLSGLTSTHATPRTQHRRRDHTRRDLTSVATTPRHRTHHTPTLAHRRRDDTPIPPSPPTTPRTSRDVRSPSSRLDLFASQRTPLRFDSTDYHLIYSSLSPPFLRFRLLSPSFLRLVVPICSDPVLCHHHQDCDSRCYMATRSVK